MKPTAPDLLRSAAALVDQALEQLDTRWDTCTECGIKHFKNVDHARVNERLSKTAERLRGSANRLEGAASIDEGDDEHGNQ